MATSVTTRYSLIAGLAKSNDLNKFKRISKAPLLKLSDKEPYQILTAPTVLKQGKKYFMWYVSCNSWKNKDFLIMILNMQLQKISLTGNKLVLVV